jgi:hypothetical protein
MGVVVLLAGPKLIITGSFSERNPRSSGEMRAERLPRTPLRAAASPCAWLRAFGGGRGQLGEGTVGEKHAAGLGLAGDLRRRG